MKANMRKKLLSMVNIVPGAMLAVIILNVMIMSSASAFGEEIDIAGATWDFVPVAAPDYILPQTNQCAYLDCKSIPAPCDIVVPPEVKNLPVVHLRFEQITCDYVRSLTTPSSVKQVVLPYSTSLKWVRMEESKPYHDATFTFSGCSALTNAVVCGQPEQWAFRGCKKLKSVRMLGSPTTIEQETFDGCEQLEEIKIPVSCTNWGIGIFSDCKKLKRVNIPYGTTSLYNAFCNCQSLEEIHLPESLTYIGGSFSGCSRLSSINFPAGVESLPMTFAGCGFEDIVIPGTVKMIGGAFSGNVALTNAVLCEGVRAINQMFNSCRNLRRIVLPASLENITPNLYNEYRGPAESIAYLLASGGDFDPDEIIVPEESPYFAMTNGFLVQKYAEPKTIRWAMWGMTDVVLPSGIECVTSGLFSRSRDGKYYPVRSAVIPEGVLTIGSSAFYNCSDLVKVEFPSSLIEIESSAFKGTGLPELTLPDSVEYIRTSAFAECPALRCVTLPASVVDAGDYSFGNDNLEVVVFKGDIPDNIEESRLTMAKRVYFPRQYHSHYWPYVGEEKFAGYTDDLPGAPRMEFVVGDSSFSLSREGYGTLAEKWPDDPVCDGCEFCGWFSAPDGGYELDASTILTSNAVCYARFSVIQPTVRIITFNANGGAGEMDEVWWTYGSVTNIPPCGFSRTGHSFVGWATNETGEVLFVDGDSVSNQTLLGDSAVTLFAVWKVNSHTLTFDVAGGSAVAPIIQDYGTEVMPPTAPTRTGYTFVGWLPELPVTMPAEDMAFTAQWKANGLVVTFSANGGMVAESSREVDKGNAVGMLPTPTREGYTFVGWYTAKTKGTKISTSTKVTKNVTYYARWTVNKYKVSAAVNEKAAGKVSGAGTKTFNGKITLKATPTKGYVFVKWENINDPDTPWPSALTYRQPSVSFKMGAANLSVRAVFAKKTADYALSLMVDPSVMWYVEDDPDREIAVVADSLSYPTVTLSGASAGIGLVRVAGTDNAYVLKVTDSSKMNPGVYTAKVTAKNRAGKSVAKSVKIVTPNSSAAIDAGLIAGLKTSTLSPYVASGGMKTKWTLADLGVDVFATNGWKLVSVTGLPTGLSWNGTAIVGTASKVGVYTVTFKMQKTVKVGKKTKTYTSTASATFKVEALLPGELAGTYNGFANTSIETVGGDEENPLYAPFVDGMASAVKVSVTTAGKITANVGGVALSGTGFDDITNGVYSVMLKKTQKITKGSLKGKSKVWELRLEIAPDASWDSAQLTGVYTAYTTGMPSMAAPTLVVAQRNAFSSDAAAKAVAAAVVASGNKGVKGFVVNKAYAEDYAYILDCAECVIGGKAVVTATAKANGTVVLAGTIAKTKVSGTAVLDVSPAAEDVYEEIRTATARFFTSKFVIEVVYSLEDGEVVDASGRVWKK